MSNNYAMSIEERTRSSDSASTVQFSPEGKTRTYSRRFAALEARLDRQRVLEAKLTILEDEMGRMKRLRKLQAGEERCVPVFACKAVIIAIQDFVTTAARIDLITGLEILDKNELR